MKIVQIIPCIKTIGGAEKFTLELSYELVKLGHDVTIIVLYNDRGFFDNYIEEKRLKVIYLDKKRGLDFKNSKRLKKLLLELKPDIVHSHLNVHSSYYLGRVLKLKNITFVETIHSAYVKSKRNPVLKNFFGIKKYIGGLYKRGKITPIAISDEIYLYTRDYFNLKKEFPTILNGVSFEKIGEISPFESRSKQFISVASLIHRKNHQAILEASTSLIDKGFTFTVTLVGTGPLYQEIEQQIKSLGLENVVSMLGERSDVFSLLNQHKVFLLPSFNEGNPLSVIEAMACGLAIIVTNVGGGVDVIKEGENGFIVDPYNTKTLISAMEKTLSTPLSLPSMSNNNILASKKYSIEETAVKYEAVYKNLLKDRGV